MNLEELEVAGGCRSSCSILEELGVDVAVAGGLDWSCSNKVFKRTRRYVKKKLRTIALIRQRR